MMWLTDGQTDRRTPYHNTTEVLLRAYKNLATDDTYPGPGEVHGHGGWGLFRFGYDHAISHQLVVHLPGGKTREDNLVRFFYCFYGAV